MAFSLMTKKGNRQQTRTIELPSDSNFAVSMKSQQAAEREEQQRIKNLVLRYDLHDENDQHDGPESHHGGSNRPRRNRPQARKLNLNDVDWYDKAKKAKDPIEERGPPQQSLDAFIIPTKAQRKDKKSG